MANKGYFIVNDGNRRHVAQQVFNTAAGDVVVIKEPGKSRDQEEKYHAMIGDIAKHCIFMGGKLELEDWKRLLVDAFVRVMRAEAEAAGRPDPFNRRGRILPSLDGSGFVQLGVQTRRFTKVLASEFIEYLYCYGCDNLVPWSESAMYAYGRATNKEAA